MEIIYLKYEEIDKQKWDSTIKNAVNRLPYAFSFYLDICSPSWDALIIDNYKFVMPLTVNKKYFVARLLQPSLSQQLGIFSNEDASAEIIKLFMDFLQKKYLSVNICLNYRNTEAALKTDLKFTQKITHHLPLFGNYDQIKKKYSTRRIRDLKKAEKNKLEVFVDNDIGAYMKFFEKTSANLMPDKHDFLRRLLYSLLQKGMLKIYTAFDQHNMPLSSLVFIIDTKLIVNILVSNTDEGKRSGANTLILDRFIKEHSSSEKILDFEGSVIESIAEFFKSFNAKEILYLQYQKNSFPFNLFKI